MSDQVQHINERQFSWMIGTIIIAGNLLIAHRELADLAGIDAWVAFQLPIVFCFCVIWLFAKLASAYPGRSLYDICLMLGGKLFGRALIMTILVHIYVIFARDVMVLTLFIKSTILRDTPFEYIALTFVVVVVYFAAKGEEVAARVNDVMYPAMVLLIFAIPLMLLNDISLERVQPMFASQASNLLLANIFNLGWFGDILVVGGFLQLLPNPRKVHAALRSGIMWAVITLSILMFMNLAVLGTNIVDKTTYPSYSLVQQIRLTDFLDRVDVFVYMFWFPISYLKISFIYISLLEGIKAFAGDKKVSRTRYNYVTALYLYITTVLSYKGIVDVFYLGNRVSVGFILLVHPLVYLSLLLLHLRRRKRREREQPEAHADTRQVQSHGQEMASPQTPQARNKQKDGRSQAKWAMWTNSLIAAMFALIVVGFLAAYYIPYGGSLTGILLAGVLAAALVTSYMELNRAE